MNSVKSSIKQSLLIIWLTTFYWSRFPDSYSIPLPPILSSALKYAFPFLVICVWIFLAIIRKSVARSSDLSKASAPIIFISVIYFFEVFLSFISGSLLDTYVPNSFRSQLLGNNSSLTGWESFTIAINNLFYFFVFPCAVLNVFGRRVVFKSIVFLLALNSYYGIMQFLAFFSPFAFRLMPITLGRFNSGSLDFQNSLRAVGFTSNNGSFFYASLLLLGSLCLLFDKNRYAKITFVSAIASLLSLSRSFIPLALVTSAISFIMYKVSLMRKKAFFAAALLVACVSCILIFYYSEIFDIYEGLISVRLDGDNSQSVRILQISSSLQNLYNHPLGLNFNPALSFDTTFGLLMYKYGFIFISLAPVLLFLLFRAFCSYYGLVVSFFIVVSIVFCYLLVGSPFSFLSQFLYGLLLLLLHEEGKKKRTAAPAT